MKRPLYRILATCMVLAALAGGIGLGLWVHGKFSKEDARPAEPEQSATTPAVTSIIQQKKSEGTPRSTAPRPLAPSLRPPSPKPQQAEVTAEGQASQESEAPIVATIRGRVVDLAGNPAALDMEVFSPEGRFNVHATNGVFLASAQPGTMQIVGQYRDGMRLLQTDPVTITAIAGEVTEATLVVNLSPAIGTPGFRYQVNNDFLEVTAVDPGSAAADAGMAPGDAIIEIGGVPVQNLDATRLDDLLNGQPGSMVQITVVAETGEGLQEFRLSLERRQLR